MVCELVPVVVQILLTLIISCFKSRVIIGNFWINFDWRSALKTFYILWFLS